VHLNQELLFVRHAAQFCSTESTVLEIGPESVPSRFSELAAHRSWTTADIAGDTQLGSRVDFTMTEYAIPVPADSFDVVLSGSVLEHVRMPWRWVPELARVCRPGGYVITIAPVSWPEHGAPVDCWRVWPEGLRALCEDSGLEVVVAVAEALEPRRSRRVYDGAGTWSGSAPSRFARVRRTIGWPTPIARDTVCVARKPPEG
jgi:SAM-dependent methyltransferase